MPWKRYFEVQVQREEESNDDKKELTDRALQEIKRVVEESRKKSVIAENNTGPAVNLVEETRRRHFGLCVKCSAVEGDGDQRSGPDSVTGRDEDLRQISARP